MQPLIILGIYISISFFHPVFCFDLTHRTVKKSCDSFVAHEEYNYRQLDNWSDVIGNWTAYYVFNWWELEPQACIGMEFKRPTRATIRRFEASLNKEIRITPRLRNASLHLVMTPGTKELLVFNGAKSGLVYGVPSRLTTTMESMRDSDELPKLHFALKTLADGQCLMAMDCADGTVTLSARDGLPRAALARLADEVDFGSPHEVCVQRSTAAPNFFG